MKSKQYKITVLRLFILIVLIFIPFVIYLMVDNKNQTAEENKNEDYEITYTNPYLPDFEIKYPKDWNIEVKEFSDDNNGVFTSGYLSSCENTCMGIRLSKSEISLDIILVMASDNNGQRCSNSVSYNEIGDGWVRVLDNLGYFYSKNYVLNTVYTWETEEVRNSNNDWDATQNEMYEICILGSGYFRDSFSIIDGYETAILVENPIINGNPDEESLSEIDEIVRNIN